MSFLRSSVLLRLAPMIAVSVCNSIAFAAPTGDLVRLLPMSLEDLINTPVVTASRRAEARDHTAAHIMVITREQIRERRYRNLADLLEDLPGVDFMRGTKSSVFNNFSVQGYNSNNKLLIMLDGVRIDHPAGGKIPVAENFALYHARQVEVLYGPAAALYGADAVAGVINVITERPAEASESWVSVGTGRFDRREVDFLATARADERLALTVGGHRHGGDRAPLDKYYPADFARVDAKTFAGDVVLPAAEREAYSGEIAAHSIFARLDIGDLVSLGHYRNFFRQLTSTGDRPDTSLYRSDARWETLIETTYARIRFDPAPNVRAELLIDHSEHEIDPRSKYLNIFTGFDDKGYVYSRSRRTGIEQSIDWSVTDRHSVQAGIGYNDYYALLTPDLPSPYDRARGPSDQGFYYANTTLPIQIGEARYHNIHTYAQMQSNWGTAWSTMIGLRYDDHSAYGDSLNPRLGAVWRASDRNVFKALAGKSFRAPSPEESLGSFGAFTGAKDAEGRYEAYGFRVPNDRLEPEVARTYSLTWDWRPRADLNFVTNAYYSRIRNLVTTLRQSVPTQFIDGAVLLNAPADNIWTTVKGNAGEEVHRGLDWIAQWRFALGPRWEGDVWGSFSWVDGHIRELDGEPRRELSYVAPRKVKIGATLRYLDWLTITPRLRWVDDTTTGRNSRTLEGKRQKTAGYAVASLHVGLHHLLDGRASLWLDVDNLFDRRYDAAHGSASTTFQDMPQQPRTWMATLEYRF